MATTLVWLTILVILLLFGLFAWSRYRQHRRRAQARSLAALNRLLADADEIAQRARREPDPGTEQPTGEPDSSTT